MTLRHIITAIILALPILAAATPTDTIPSRQSFKDVVNTTITERPDGSTIAIITNADGTTRTVEISSASSDKTTTTITTRSFLSLRPTDSRWSAICGGWSLGWTFAPGHPDNMPVEAGKSWEISWANVLGVAYDASKTTRLSLGFGLNWRNYKITTPDFRFATDGRSNIEMLPYPADVEPRNSRLKVFNLQIPLAIKQQMPFRLFGQQQWIAVGFTLNYASHASMLTRWRDASGRSIKHTDNHIGQRRWSYELSAIAGLSEDVGIYLRYQPQSVLRGASQPDFSALSTGIILFY